MDSKRVIVPLDFPDAARALDMAARLDPALCRVKVGKELFVSEGPAIVQFIADKEGDSWYMCFMTFQKYMLCNERSHIKVDEAHLYNKGFFDYPCYDELEHLFDVCGPDLFEPLFELYRVRLMSGKLKP